MRSKGRLKPRGIQISLPPHGGGATPARGENHRDAARKTEAHDLQARAPLGGLSAPGPALGVRGGCLGSGAGEGGDEGEKGGLSGPPHPSRPLPPSSVPVALSRPDRSDPGTRRQSGALEMLALQKSLDRPVS